MAKARNWRTIALWIVVATLAVLVIAWLGGAFEGSEPPEAISPETMPEQPQPETVEPDGIVPSPQPQQ